MADFEATGIRLRRMPDLDQEKVLLWMIDKSRHLDARNVDKEFAIDMGPEIKNRTMGATLANLAEKGGARIVATHDGNKAIVQMIVTPGGSQSAEFDEWADYWRNQERQ